MTKPKKGAAVLRARAEAYGGQLTRSAVFRITLPIVAVYTTGAMLMYIRIIPTILWFLGSLLGAFMLEVPANISLNYYRDGLVERHLFISSMSEALANKSQSFLSSLHMAQFGLHGEFKQDLSRLENTLQHTSRDDYKRHLSFMAIKRKYFEDTYFCQFMDQLEDSAQSGEVDQKTCDNISRFHNALFNQQRDYIHKRHFSMQCEYGFIYLMYACFLIVVCIFGFGRNYLDLWAYSITSDIFGSMFLLFITFGLGLAYHYDHDESLMTV